MVKRVAAVFTAAVFAVLLTGGTAWAQEPQNFTVLGINDNPATVIANGEINGRGVEEEIEEAFDEETGEFTLDTSFVFEDGTVFLTVEGTADITVDPVSCVGRFTASGTYDITSGSGDFEGATGDGTVTARSIFIAGRNADGSCSEDEADEQFSFLTAQLRGDISFEEPEAT